VTTCVTVKTQTELDTALADTDACAHIESPAGVWLKVSGSASVRASDSASVRASGSASVRASDSASVSASGSASVRAFDSASVSASDSASVSASGSASVRASGSASVSAGTHVAVHLHSAQATVTGGVLIDLTQLDLTDPAAWCAHHGADVADGIAVLYKAVDLELTAGHDYTPTLYPLGASVECDDYQADGECGGGLHLCPTPGQAAEYRPQGEKSRYLKVRAALVDLSPIVDAGGPAKVKARRVDVLAEVDLFGRELTAASAT
jgi:hypothetical protein